MHHTTTCQADCSLGTLHKRLHCISCIPAGGAFPLLSATAVNLPESCLVDSTQGKSDSHPQSNWWPNLSCQMIEDKLQNLTLLCLAEHTTHIHTQPHTNYDQGR